MNHATMRPQTAWVKQEIIGQQASHDHRNSFLNLAGLSVGGWHLVRIYEKISSRFHLADWHRSIDGKLKTLDDLYQILKQDQNYRVMLWLEIAIVLLFIIDLVILMLEMKEIRRPKTEPAMKRWAPAGRRDSSHD